MSAATLKSVAQSTGFSITTVSRALGGFDDVSEQTRRIILDEALRQGYVPNLQARALQARRTQMVGLILPVTGPRFLDPFFSEFVAGVGSTMVTAGFDLLLSTYHTSENELDVYRRIIQGRHVDGLILIRSRYDDIRIKYLSEMHMPFVVYGRTTSTDNYVFVDVDGLEAQSLLTQHFIDLGHRRIGYIAPPHELMFTHFRLQGFYETMKHNGIPVDQDLIVEGNLTEQSGSDAAARLLDSESPPTAIMTGNDVMAFGVMHAIQERGLIVGQDIAVGGFDDIPLAAHVHPGLTTIHQPIYEIGQQIARTLLQLVEKREVSNPGALVKPELVVRASSGPPHDL